MMYNTCSPAAAPHDKRGMVQPALALRGSGRKPHYFEGNVEPSIDELMDDDVMRRVMARDGVQPEQLRSLLDCMRTRLR
jgi:hypothetical protein